MSPSFSKRGPVATRSAASLSASVTRALSEAAERARDRVAAGDRGASSASELLLLRETILGLAGGSDEMPRREELHLFSRRAIDTLRFEFLAGLRDGAARRISSRELVAVLTAMDAIEGPAEQENRADGDGRHANAEALNGMLEIAHDMRSPLGAILLLVDPLRRGRQGPVTPVQERQFSAVRQAQD